MSNTSSTYTTCAKALHGIARIGFIFTFACLVWAYGIDKELATLIAFAGVAAGTAAVAIVLVVGEKWDAAMRQCLREEGARKQYRILGVQGSDSQRVVGLKGDSLPQFGFRRREQPDWTK